MEPAPEPQELPGQRGPQQHSLAERGLLSVWVPSLPRAAASALFGGAPRLGAPAELVEAAAVPSV